MPFPDELNAVASITVGDAGSQSAAYPVMRLTSSEQLLGPDEASAGAVLERIWTVRAHAFAHQLSGRATLRELLTAQLVRWGETVTVWEHGVARRMLPADAIRGYPRTSIDDLDEASAGVRLGFTLRAVTREPVAGAAGTADVAEHDATTEIEVNELGQVRTRVSGRVRVTAGTAAAWIEANVFAAARGDAASQGLSFTTRVRTGLDAAAGEYEHVAFDAAGGGFGANITSARVNQRESSERGRARVTQIDGEATGLGAAAFATASAPLVGPAQILTRQQVGQPELPTGRVAFSYEVLTGVAAGGGWGDAFLLAFDESIEPIDNTPPIVAATFLGAPPTLYRGALPPARYLQRSRAEFVGTFAQAIAGLTGLMDPAHLDGPPRIVQGERRNGIKEISITRTYTYSTPPAVVPEPRTVVFL